MAGKEGNPNASEYSVSKAAVIGFTKSLGKELATQGILVNAITPATFESPLLTQLPASQVDYMRSKIPMGRPGEIAESAAMICFMASEEFSSQRPRPSIPRAAGPLTEQVLGGAAQR